MFTDSVLKSLMTTFKIQSKSDRGFCKGCLDKLEFSSEDKERENQKAQHTQGM